MHPVTQTDIDEITILDSLLFPENCFNERTLSTEVSLGLGWVVYHERALVGYVLVRDDARYLDIIRIGVHPNYQRRQLGTQLLKKVLEKRRDTILTVREGNTAALRLYLKHDFKLVGRLLNGQGWVCLHQSS